MKISPLLLNSLFAVICIPISLVDIYAQQEPRKIDTVTVHKPVSSIENTSDKLLYHIDRDKNLRGKTAEDIFRRLPMVALHYDGQVSLRGDRNVKILINGKPWSAANNSVDVALRMLSSDQIKTIELMTSPSAKYDAEGSGGIINIITKQPKISGFTGSLSTTVSSRQSQSNANLTARTGRWNLSSGAGTTWSWPVNTVVSSQLWGQDKEPIYSQVNQSKNRRQGIQSNTSINYEIDSTASLLSTINLNQLDIHTDNRIVNEYNSAIPYLAYTTNKLSTRNFDIGLDYLKRLPSNLGELDIAFQYLRGQSETNYNSTYDMMLHTAELGYNLGDNQEFTLQVDYQTKIKQTTLNIGGKIVDRYLHSTVDIDSLFSDGHYTDSKDRSFIFNYRQTVQAAYATANFRLSTRLQASPGIRYERTVLRSTSYQHLFPYLALALSNERGHTYKLKYGQRIQRPSLYFLNPFRNTADKINQQQGNPALRAETSHHIDLEGSFSANAYNTVVNTSLYYKRLNDIIEPVLQHSMENGGPITLQSFENVGRASQVGFNLYSSHTFFKRLSIRANVDLFTYRISPYSIFADQTEQAHKTFLNYKLFGGMDLNLGKSYVLESGIFFDSPQRTFHGSYAAFNFWNLGVKKKMRKESLTVGLSVVDPFRPIKNLRSYSSSPLFLQQNNFALPFRSFGASVSWHFGRHNPDLSPSRTKKILNDDQKTQP